MKRLPWCVHVGLFWCGLFVLLGVGLASVGLVNDAAMPPVAKFLAASAACGTCVGLAGLWAAWLTK